MACEFRRFLLFYLATLRNDDQDSRGPLATLTSFVRRVGVKIKIPLDTGRAAPYTEFMLITIIRIVPDHHVVSLQPTVY
jgi:hypothetical protein